MKNIGICLPNHLMRLYTADCGRLHSVLALLSIDNHRTDVYILDGNLFTVIVVDLKKLPG